MKRGLPSYDRSISPERLRALLHYDPNTGVFTHLDTGDTAGRLSSHGYIEIRIDGLKVKAHRLAWLWMTGRPPEAFIDHRDCDKANNRWANLREANGSQNGANALKRQAIQGKPTTSQHKGVYWNKTSRRWIAAMRWRGKFYHLGAFLNEADAIAAREAKAKEVHGEFVRFT